MTQWPDYRFWLRGTGTSRHEPDPSRAADKRALDRLMDAAANWNARGRKDEDLARGGELAEFEWLRTASFRDPGCRHWSGSSSTAAWRRAKQQSEERQHQLETLRQLARTRRRQTWGAIAAALLLLLRGRRCDLAMAEVEARGQQMAAEANTRLADAQLDEAKRIDFAAARQPIAPSDRKWRRRHRHPARTARAARPA